MQQQSLYFPKLASHGLFQFDGLDESACGRSARSVNPSCRGRGVVFSSLLLARAS